MSDRSRLTIAYPHDRQRIAKYHNERRSFHQRYGEFSVRPQWPSSADGWAIELGSFAATYRVSAKDDPINVSDKGMRVLKRQSDGSWKFALVGLK